MHLLAREEVGLRCLLQVAGHSGPQPLAIHAIAEAEGLTPEYAAKLLRRLRLGGIVTSVRGAAGGYRLTRPAGEITVWQAIQVLDDATLPQDFCDCRPGERRDCDRTFHCALQGVWRKLGRQVQATLEGITLECLCRPTGPGDAPHLPVVA